MRLPNQSARDQLLSVLGRRPRSSTTEIAAALGLSVRSLHRMLAELPPEQWVCAGQARRTRYARRRALRGAFANIPLYEIGESGEAKLVSKLALICPEGSLMPLTASAWPVPPDSDDGWWEGLPYPIYDMRPQGFIGRQFARAEHLRLGVAQNPDEWNDDDVVAVLSRTGWDMSGNLLLGDEAHHHWLNHKLAPNQPVIDSRLGEHYVRQAHNALGAGVPTSSAAGEFPKFTALREQGQDTPHVLVKFSGAGESAAERRWADLLVCEHLALECASTLDGVKCARTRILQESGRTFFESERFDRIGQHGRLPLCSLESLVHALIGGNSTDWPVLAARLHGLGLLRIEVISAVQRLWWYGRLIGNTDMHLGNLSLYIEKPLRLAPAYDMLPMTYAPLPGGEVPPREFSPPLPLPEQRDVWNTACEAALDFWRRAGADTRISEPFQRLSTANGIRLEQIASKI
ncbi:MAG: type II toxin-antitoxin system HipA family toxin YjjJ [Burkholderiales bacterium]